MPPGMYSTILLSEIMRLSAFKSPLFYPSSQVYVFGQSIILSILGAHSPCQVQKLHFRAFLYTCRSLFLHTLYRKSNLCILRKGIAQPQSQFLHSCVCERIIYSQNRSTYIAAASQTDRSWKNINLSQIFKCRNWETEHFNSVLEIMRLHNLISGNT